MPQNSFHGFGGASHGCFLSDWMYAANSSLLPSSLSKGFVPAFEDEEEDEDVVVVVVRRRRRCPPRATVTMR